MLSLATDCHLYADGSAHPLIQVWERPHIVVDGQFFRAGDRGKAHVDGHTRYGIKPDILFYPVSLTISH